MKTGRLLSIFKERVGAEITSDDLEVITQIVLNGEAEIAIWEKGHKEAVYKVNWNELSFYAIFHVERKEILTFKSLDMKIILNSEEEWY